MALNFPGPYELRIIQTSPNITPGGQIQHVTRVNLDLATDPGAGGAFSTYVVKVASGTDTALHIVVEDFLNVLRALHNTGHSYDVVELWKYPTPQSFDSQFWATYEPTIVAGTSGGTPVAAGEVIHTFRTTEGGIMKLNVLEGPTAPTTPRTYANIGASGQALVDYILGGGTGYGAPFLARDTSYPFAFIRQFPGQNEAIFKKRFRPSS